MSELEISEKEILQTVKNADLRHIAIIMDGNRRWAKERLLTAMMGHKKGVEALKITTKACNDYGIKYLTLYAFSTENWNRRKEEVEFLMDLLAKTLLNELDELDKNNVKLNFIGNLSRLNENLQKIIKNSKEKTKNNTGVILTVAINYGSRDEIVFAVKNIIKSGIKESGITEETIADNLYTYNLPDPDLLIRTSGEMRISNYLLWQIAYSEIYVTDTYWPEFDKNSLKNAIVEFAKRQRRRGR